MSDLIIGGRQSGKTRRCLLLSSERQVPILTHSRIMVRELEEREKRMELDIPTPVALADIGLNRGRVTDPEYIIDEAEIVLEKLLGGKVDTLVHTLNEHDDSQITFLNPIH